MDGQKFGAVLLGNHLKWSKTGKSLRIAAT